MKRFQLAVILAFGLVGFLAGSIGGCGGGERPKERKKVKHGSHWDYEDEKHEDDKDKSAPKPGTEEKKPA